ncbi:MAG: pirin family protein [Phycisphaerales bacterium]|nr:pirin family protein [Phycisphaerales bacterium]
MAIAPSEFEVRQAEDRGTTEIGWLHSRHSFSFGRYYDPTRVSYHGLRVLNDDIVAAGQGFGEHGHDNMEIITWVLEGELAHADSTGTRGTLMPGEAQVMTAGRGIRHSEMNGSSAAPAHFIQIWIEPDQRNLEPAYAQKSFPPDRRHNQWQLIASPDERNGSLRIHQDAAVHVADLDEGKRLKIDLVEGRHGYLHVATGCIRFSAAELKAGDAVTFDGPAQLDIEALTNSQVLLFDLP